MEVIAMSAHSFTPSSFVNKIIYIGYHVRPQKMIKFYWLIIVIEIQIFNM